MPHVARHGPYRFYFYSDEGDEPPHIHVGREHRTAKFWLTTVALARRGGFNDPELRRIEAVVRTHQLRFLEVWHAYFAD
jgi:hypothetical protein